MTRNQRGQTTIEYLLLTFVIVVALGGTLLAFSKSAKTFIQNYYGEYFQCLLETGELPTLGGDDNSTAECDSSFQPFTFAGGRPPVDNSVNGGDGSGASGTSGSKDASKDSNSTNGGAAPVAASSASDGDGGFVHSNKVPLSQADGVAANKNGDNNGRPQYFNFGHGGGDEEESSGRPALVPAGGIYSKLKEEDASDKKVLAKAETEEMAQQPPKRVPANLDKRPEKTPDADTSLTLPDFLKYLLIIGIILAIVIFFGGQILNFQKSQE